MPARIDFVEQAYRQSERRATDVLLKLVGLRRTPGQGAIAHCLVHPMGGAPRIQGRGALMSVSGHLGVSARTWLCRASSATAPGLCPGSEVSPSKARVNRVTVHPLPCAPNAVPRPGAQRVPAQLFSRRVRACGACDDAMRRRGGPGGLIARAEELKPTHPEGSSASLPFAAGLSADRVLNQSHGWLRLTSQVHLAARACHRKGTCALYLRKKARTNTERPL